ncbi:pyruvate kinase [Desulfolithobacter sp.]
MQQVIRKTKIVCTIGPATASPKVVKELIRAGMNVARLNFSHGNHKEHSETIKIIRQAAREEGRPVGILQDLAGPKIRLGQVEKRHLTTGEEILLTSGTTATGNELPVNYPYLCEDLSEGETILLADGRVELQVLKVFKDHIVARVVNGGMIMANKGVNLPASDLRIPAFTEKDRADLEFGLSTGVDFVAMSFVRHEKDLEPLLQRTAGNGTRPLLIAKIEKPQAVDRLGPIIEAVDGVMVARGDLGVEMPLEDVPVIQKEIIFQARTAGKVVITATQMLGSMVESPRPSRAEVTDVANAILDGTDAVMLSEETAVGQYPVQAVEVLNRIAIRTEASLDPRRFIDDDITENLPLDIAAVSRAAAWMANDLKAELIVAATTSGSTARVMSRLRLPIPIIGLTSDPKTQRQSCLSYGVIPALVPVYDDLDEMLWQVNRYLKDEALARKGNKVILTAGTPLDVPGTTNLIKVMEID